MNKLKSELESVILQYKRHEGYEKKFYAVLVTEALIRVQDEERSNISVLDNGTSELLSK